MDFIGFGKSATLKEPFSVADYGKWTKTAMDLLHVQHPHVIAHSFGCRVAVKMASESEDVFDKILLTGPAGIILSRGIKYKLNVKAYRFAKRFAPTWAEKRFGSTEYRSLSPIMKESYKKIVNEDLRFCAKQVRNEVLIVEGLEDTVTTMKEAEIYLESFEKGRLKTMQGGHFAFAEHPFRFNLIAEEFFYE